MGSLMRRPVLQLNASFEALRIISAKRALTLLTKGKALTELSTNHEIYPGVFLPSVIRLVVYKHVPIRMQILSRRNIHIRDGYRCAYCGNRFRGDELSLDHVIPKSRGGRGTFENLVSACKKCNHKKADRTPSEANMPLLFRPIPATVHSGRFLLRTLGLETQEWGKYLYADNKGDQRFTFVGA